MIRRSLYIENEKVKSLPEAKQRADAEQIVAAELEAMFTRNSFDPDGHIGTWLIDTKNGRLVRIDYAQIRKVNKAEMNRMKSVLNALFIPRLEALDFGALANNLDVMLDFPSEALMGEKEKIRILKEVASRSDFPSHMDPHQRLFMVRTELEKFLSQSLGIGLDSDQR